MKNKDEIYYCIDETFFTDPIDYLQREVEDFDKSDLLFYPDDYKLEAYVCKEEKMAVVDAETFIWAIDEERFDEDRTQEDKLKELFNKYIDFEAINREMPKLWHPTTEVKVWTKNELLQWNR